VGCANDGFGFVGLGRLHARGLMCHVLLDTWMRNVHSPLLEVRGSECCQRYAALQCVLPRPSISSPLLQSIPNSVVIQTWVCIIQARCGIKEDASVLHHIYVRDHCTMLTDEWADTPVCTGEVAIGNVAH